jgi:N12 class adenine-specific DNA methylase
VIVDEMQEFRKLSFATNQTTLKGVDPDGSQRAWDLYVKTRYIDATKILDER